ncbi:UL16-binding protein 3-like [Diceros bicornis minor]|uniref:UL16-binding protein 3-like n=1 Tax=Diceros bicornis minor TaxID=77932 RepID=UPI0026EA248E|nr:UL16-binding protein 3-like [Diceros bicornis minor]
MMCQCKAHGRTSASWQFGFHGQMFLLFGSENGTWTVLQPGGRRMRDMWESDRDMTEFFRKISTGDCRRWLENFLVHWLKTQETTDACSFCYDLTIIPEPRPGQPWCEVQGQVDRKTFLSYDCGSDEVKSLSLLGEEVNDTRVWQEQMETLRDVGDLLRQQLPDIELEKYMDRDPLPLQGRMMCQCKAHGHTSASWQFGFHGQMFLLFGSENGTWTVLQPGGRRMRDMWESDRDVTEFFRKISMGDCRRWLENFSVPQLKTQETTASPTSAPATAQSRPPAIMPIAWILLVTLTCFTILDILGSVHYITSELDSAQVNDLDFIFSHPAGECPGK